MNATSNTHSGLICFKPTADFVQICARFVTCDIITHNPSSITHVEHQYTTKVWKISTPIQLKKKKRKKKKKRRKKKYHRSFWILKSLKVWLGHLLGSAAYRERKLLVLCFRSKNYLKLEVNVARQSEFLQKKDDKLVMEVEVFLKNCWMCFTS